jgi:polysaccharide deacetylase family protein (PEP-CTERM system associated)
MIKMVNALSIDVEDYWSIFSRDWLSIDAEPSDTVVRNTEWFLEALARHNVKATFFILGEVAEKFPSLIKKIAEAGHEVGSHGFSHKQIFNLDKEEFQHEVADCRKLLEDITSGPILGYRAPAFSITPPTKWALDILAQEGFKYDSSVYPILGKRYGWPEFSKNICKVDLPSGRSMIEVPLSTVTIWGKTLPIAGGGYIRHFPYAVTRWAIRRIQKTRPVIVYMHPYEIDTRTPHPYTVHLSNKVNRKARRFHRMQLRNRDTVGWKFNKLLNEFKFTAIMEIISSRFAYRSAGHSFFAAGFCNNSDSNKTDKQRAGNIQPGKGWQKWQALYVPQVSHDENRYRPLWP